MKLSQSPPEQGLRQWLRTLVSSIAAGWAIEHTGDGTHDWHWTTPAFDANRFRGDGTITWSVGAGDRAHERYAVLGTTLLYTVVVSGSSTGGTASTELRIVLPDGYRVAPGSGLTVVGAVAYALDAGTLVAARVVATGDTNYLAVLKNDGTNWSNASAGNASVYFQIVCEVTRD